MRRLTLHLKRSLAAHRERGERGAVAVITALSMVVLLGFVALAVDVGAMYEERAELQSAADAAALAVAQDCTKGLPCTPDATLPRAREYAAKNVRDGSVNVLAPEIVGNTVKVKVATRQADGTGALALSFAPILGIDSAKVGATATTQWGLPQKGPAILPIALSPCDFRMGAGPQVLRLHGSNGAGTCSTHQSSSGLNMAGGFGMVVSPAGECTAVLDAGAIATSSPGNSLIAECLPVLQQSLGRTVLLPVYDDMGGTGTSGWYRIKGWAGFKILGWRFPSMATNNTLYPNATCDGSCTGIIGEFVHFGSINDSFTTGGPDLGGSVITMKE